MNSLNHLALVMDGNGRWAKKRGLLRTGGHEVGAEVVEQICEFCIDESIANLTLYAFSTENWKRPKSEVEFLMKLLQKFLISRREKFIQNGIKFYPIGDISAFEGDLRSEIEYLSNLTQNGRALNFNLAINYGSRDEIVRACERLLASGERLSEAGIGAHLDTAHSGDVDLLVRTGGEQRLSNFLLWQASYAELAFTPTLWPDFTREELARIVDDFRRKQRRFGGL
ncbi:polyprenyl diphosphate synthase [uncultured Campylobacter sp.]|uniref:polyprenyl diphosphate synthase n=1 Tax=uncultured Campylobacter sp. TaxID=218934 RepID=UPI002629D4B9|nr:polyprenyl diphosphate synthase [uncultured Campylobacter sp.]